MPYYHIFAAVYSFLLMGLIWNDLVTYCNILVNPDNDEGGDEVTTNKA
jgi:hypothetical protein